MDRKVTPASFWLPATVAALSPQLSLPPPPSLSSSFYFFKIQPISWASPSPPPPHPSFCKDGRQERRAICTTLSWIVLRCLATAAVTVDRVRRFACVFTPQKKRKEKKRRRKREQTGRETWDVSCRTQNVGKHPKELLWG